MHDFPPFVPDFTAGSRLDQSPRRRSSTRDFANPDTRSAARLLVWTVRQQTPIVLLVSLMSLVQMLPASLGPYLVGRVVDDGIIARDMSAVVDWCAALLAIVILGVAGGILGHTLIVRVGVGGEGGVARDVWGVVGWCAALLAIVILGVAGGILGHALIVRMWLVVLYA